MSRRSRLWSVVSREDGESYLVRLFSKTGTDVDGDLRRLLQELVRRIRGVLAKQAARQVLLEIVDVVEDDNEFGIRLLGDANPFSQLNVATRRRLSERARATSGRAPIWHEVAGLARAIGYLHSADIVHGNINEESIFVDRVDPLELKLGGYEGCVHVGSVGTTAVSLLKPNKIVSLAQDWSDFGTTVKGLLLGDETERPILLPSEQRLLDRLRVSPQFEPLDGASLAADIEELCSELERVGSSGRHELVMVPEKDVLRRDVSSFLGDRVSELNSQEIIGFLQDDLNRLPPLIAPANGARRFDAQIFTDSAVYDIRFVSDQPRIGRLVGCRPRGSNSPTFTSHQLRATVHIARHTADARDRVRRTGGGAALWPSACNPAGIEEAHDDAPQWHALNLIEAFSLLLGRLRHYPVEIVATQEVGKVKLTPRVDIERDAWRSELGRQPATSDLELELERDDGCTEWTLTTSDAFSVGGWAPSLELVGIGDSGGRRVYEFCFDGNLPETTYAILRPRSDRGAEESVRRRLRHIASVRENKDLLLAIDNPGRIVLEDAVRNVASPGDHPKGMDASKVEAWEAIRRGNSIDLVVGPPGVGKTYLISRLVGSILELSPHARILVSAQNHDVLAEMHRKLREDLGEQGRIVVRIERASELSTETVLREKTKSLLRAVTDRDPNPLLRERHLAVKRLLDAKDPPSDSESEAILRDTDNLVTRSADILLATANSSTIEELASEGERFDWVVIEEAARASGSELIGPLLLGDRRVLIGDHHQLPPFDADRKARYYEPDAAKALLSTFEDGVENSTDLPGELAFSISAIKSNESLLQDVIATAARLEQPFREIAESLDEPQGTEKRKPYVSILTEQSRMHPAISSLVSNTFYAGKLRTAARVSNRTQAIRSSDPALETPIVVLDLPALSRTEEPAFEELVGTSRRNRSEARSVLCALDRLSPSNGESSTTLAILTPFAAQRDYLRAELAEKVDSVTGTLSGFASPKGDGEFVHTVDGFQGGEADLVIVSLVRNSQDVGPRALGFLSDRRRMNVLLSRARHKLVLVTSLRFLRNAVTKLESVEWGGNRLEFLSLMLSELDDMANDGSHRYSSSASIVACDLEGQPI